MSEEEFDPKVPDPGNGFEAMSVLELIKECRDSWKSIAKPYLARGEFNERMVNGDQWYDVSDKFELVDSDWPDYASKSTRNLIRNLCLTYASKLVEDRPFVAAFPVSPDADIQKAKIATKVLRYTKDRVDWDEIQFTAAMIMQLHGSVGFKTVWDPLGGPVLDPKPVIDETTGVPAVDENGEPLTEGGGPAGEIVIEIVSIFEFGTDGAQSIERSNWAYFSRYADKYEAKALLRAAGYPQDKIDGLEDTEYEDVWGDKHMGVLLTELWYRPGFRFPDGLYTVSVGDHIVAMEKYPYEHRELPLSIAKIAERRGSPFGATHVNDAAPIQRSINRIVSALDQQARQIASVYLMAHPSVIEAIEEGNNKSGMIPVNDPAWSQYTRYVEPPNRVQVLVESLDDNTNALFAVFGLNELLTGAESMKSGTAAKSIAFLNKLDSMKMSGASRSFNKAIIRVWRQVLRLVQQYMPDEMFIEVASADGSSIDLELFRTSDFAGMDVKLEPMAGMEAFSASGQQQAMDEMQVQGPTPDLVDRMNTGLDEGRIQASDRRAVQTLVQQMSTGQQVQADPNIDPQTAIMELTTVASSFAGSPAYQAITQLIMQYKQMLQQSQMQMQAQPAQGVPQ